MDDTGIFARIFGARHMTPEIPFNFKALVTHGIVFLQRELFANHRGYGAYAWAPEPMDLDESIDVIAEKIRRGEPFMAGKIGTGDGETLSRYLDITAKEPKILKFLKMLVGLRGPFWWDNSIRASICVCAGVFPPTDAAIEEFCRIFMSYCGDMDFYISFTPAQYRLHKLLCPNARTVLPNALGTFNHAHNWFGALAGKKVLVVHQYPATIRAQYEKNVEFHKGQGPLPRFKELITYRPVNSIGGKCDEFPNWPAALKKMMDDVSKIDFDVALLGCGVYGVPLSVHIKRMGKIAIYTGGSTQIVFGIKGRRWDNLGAYNEHWVRPFPDDAPANMCEIEGGTFL